MSVEWRAGSQGKFQGSARPFVRELAHKQPSMFAGHDISCPYRDQKVLSGTGKARNGWAGKNQRPATSKTMCCRTKDATLKGRYARGYRIEQKEKRAALRIAGFEYCIALEFSEGGA